MRFDGEIDNIRGLYFEATAFYGPSEDRADVIQVLHNVIVGRVSGWREWKIFENKSREIRKRERFNSFVGCCIVSSSFLFLPLAHFIIYLTYPEVMEIRARE